MPPRFFCGGLLRALAACEGRLGFQTSSEYDVPAAVRRRRTRFRARLHHGPERTERKRRYLFAFFPRPRSFGEAFTARKRQVPCCFRSGVRAQVRNESRGFKTLTQKKSPLLSFDSISGPPAPQLNTRTRREAGFLRGVGESQNAAYPRRVE